MKHRGRLTLGLHSLLTTFALLGSVAVIAPAQNGYISFDVPHARGTVPKALNQNGLIAGYYLDAAQVQHIFLRSRKGVFVTSEPSNTASSFITSVNTGGAAVGQYTDTNSMPHGFLRNAHGTYRNINVPGTLYTNPNGINDVGQVTGNAFDAQFAHGFLWDVSGTVVLFDVPGGTGFTAARAINASGAITGYYANGNKESGYVRDSAGNITTFDAGTGTQTLTHPLAINSNGQITGTFADDVGAESAFLREVDGTITLFQGPELTETDPTSINDLGVIVGLANFELGFSAFERDAAGNVSYIPIPFSNVGSLAAGITNGGHMTGYYIGTDFRFHGWAN